MCLTYLVASSTLFDTIRHYSDTLPTLFDTIQHYFAMPVGSRPPAITPREPQRFTEGFRVTAEVPLPGHLALLRVVCA